MSLTKHPPRIMRPPWVVFMGRGETYVHSIVLCDETMEGACRRAMERDHDLFQVIGARLMDDDDVLQARKTCPLPTKDRELIRGWSARTNVA
jgi:hypothetical protein